MTKRAPRVTRLPEPLPKGESILWRGAPRAWPVAVRVFHIRAVAIYFAALLVWRGAASFHDTGSVLTALVSFAWMLPLALVGLGILGLLAWLVKRTTVYTITSRRLVFQFGIAFPMTFNLPFTQIGNAELKLYRDGTGDIPVTLVGSTKIAYLVLWPHARPWTVRRPEPMLRVVPDAANVAEILSRALAANAEAESATESASTESASTESATGTSPSAGPDNTDPTPPPGVSDDKSAAA